MGTTSSWCFSSSPPGIPSVTVFLNSPFQYMVAPGRELHIVLAFFFPHKFHSQCSCYLSLSLGASFLLELLKYLEQSYLSCLILDLLHFLFCRTNDISSSNLLAEVRFSKPLSPLLLLQTQSHLSLSALSSVSSAGYSKCSRWGQPTCLDLSCLSRRWNKICAACWQHPSVTACFNYINCNS